LFRWWTKKDFILNYVVDGNLIKVNYANGDVYPLPYSKENENKVLEKMEEQVDNSFNYSIGIEKKKNKARFWMIYDSAFIALNVFFIVVSNINFFNGLAIVLFSLGFVANAKSFKECNKILKDIEKNQLFLNNVERINNYLAAANEKSKEDTMNPVKLERNSNLLTINDAHDMSYNEVNHILNDMDRDESFGVDRPKVLLKNYIKKKNK